MFVDASALTAILIAEPDADELEDRIFASSTSLLISPLAVFETVLAVAPRLKLSFAAAEAEILAYLDPKIRIIDVTPEIGRLAIDAHARYGRGTGHPAKLNMGDCFAYACAKAHGVSLLYKGADFVHTDLA